MKTIGVVGLANAGAGDRAGAEFTPLPPPSPVGRPTWTVITDSVPLTVTVINVLDLLGREQ